MRKNKCKTMLTCGLLAGVVLLSGCAGTGGSQKTKNENAITVALGSEAGSLDPGGMIATTYLAYSVTALDELLTYKEDGTIDYRAAESYEVNEDATVYTFHLRKEAIWSDGSPVTAEDFLNTMRRALDPASQNGYANYLFPIENAEAVYNGEKSMSELGVEIPDDYTLRFHLNEPCVYFLDLMRLPVYTPSNAANAKQAGDGWDKNPETSLSNGPFYLAEYEPEQYFVLKKNPEYWNADEVKLDEITYRFFDDQQSMANAYKTGEVDVAAGLPSAVMEEYDGKADLFITESVATRYIYPNLNVKPLDDVRVRKALNLAVDREELCKGVGADTSPTVNFVARYLKDKETGENFIDEADPPFEENVQEAKQLLSEAGYPDGKGFPKLTYKYPSIEMDSNTAQILKEQWKKNLGIEIELQAQELQVNYADRRAGDFDLCRMNWTADFADPNTYLSMLLSNSTYNCSGVNDSVYDEIVGNSDIETDPVKRNALMHQAEQYAVGEQFYMIPLYSMKSCNLVNPEIRDITQIAASGALEYRYASIEQQ